MQPLTASEVRELDRRAIEEFGVPSMVLMENASRRAAEVIRESLEREGLHEVLVLAGPGNNGGDGLAIARTLDNWGVRVRVHGHGLERARVGSDVARQVELLRSHGLGIEPVERATPGGGTLVVDALFGTGLSRELSDPFPALFARMAQAYVLAIDVPSGLDATTGEILGTALEANETVTFVAPKVGFFHGHGPELVGRTTVAEIGIPRRLLDELRR